VPAASRELVQAVREQAGLDVVSLTPAGGESGAAFWARERGGGTWVLKIAAGPAAEAAAQLRVLDTVTGLLRERGYPAPRVRAIGAAAASEFWITERLPGHDLSVAGGAGSRPRWVA
jgi:hypothetical protein